MASAQRKQDAAIDARAVRLNLAGQRLGRKGQETRERVLSAALRLFDDAHGPPVTLTGVAREASMRLSNLYLYFPDMIHGFLTMGGAIPAAGAAVTRIANALDLLSEQENQDAQDIGRGACP